MGGLKNKKYKKYYLAILFAVVLVLLPTHPAEASGCIFSTSPLSQCILEGTSYLLYLMFTIVGSGIAALAGALQWVINLPVYPADGQRIAVIDESWKIMRNFANMFFIVALIMMAFATIFDVFPGAAKYNARALFGRFLFTALLINFSLVLGVLVIQGAQVLNNTFLTAIGDMSGRLGQGLNPSLLFPKTGATTTAAQAVDQGLFGMLIQLIFALILAVTFLFSLLTATIFAFVRIPIIWALLVVSPIAWILNVFPAGQGMFKKWWSTFIGWNMFLPIFLFFLYFGLYFLQGQNATIKAIAGSTGTGNIFGDTVTSFTFQMLFMYIMAGIFLIGGTIVAMKASMFSGTGVVGVAKWARGIAARRVGAYVPGRGFVSLEAARIASQEKLGEIQKEGLPGRFGRIYGGEAGFEKQTDVARRLLGVRGGFKGQKDEVDNINKEESQIKDQETAGQVRIDDNFKKKAFELGANTAKGAAMRAVLYERGMIDQAEFVKDMTGWVEKNPFLAEAMSEKAKKGGFKNIKPDELLKMAAAEGSYSGLKTPGAIASRKIWFDFIKENDKALGQMTLEQYGVAVDLLGGPKTEEADKLKKAVGKKRADLTVEYDIKSKKLKDDPRIRAAQFFKEIRTKSARDLSQMVDKVWQNQGFQDALKLRIKVLDKSDPEVRAGEIPPGSPPGTLPLKKSKAGGGTVFQNTLRKSVGGDYKKLRIARELRPITDFDETFIEAGAETTAEGVKKEESKK